MGKNLKFDNNTCGVMLEYLRDCGYNDASASHELFLKGLELKKLEKPGLMVDILDPVFYLLKKNAVKNSFNRNANRLVKSLYQMYVFDRIKKGLSPMTMSEVKEMAIEARKIKDAELDKKFAAEFEQDYVMGK